MESTLRKYNRTYHLPFSESITSDDKVAKDFSLIEGSEIVVLEKMDGECTSIYKDYHHARSLDSGDTEWRSHIQILQNLLSPMLGNSILNGENMYAKHSIHYQNLESYFYAFSMWENDIRYDWDSFTNFIDTYNKEAYSDFKIAIPKVLYRGAFDIKVLEKIASSLDTSKQEGFVLQPVNSFHRKDFEKYVMKYVRKNHVQTDDHWMNSAVVKNKLKAL